MSGLLYLSVSQNSIEGELPSDIGELKAIVELYLYNNHFSGVILTRLGELQNLQYIDLSNNSFFGQIPLSFANLISLEFLNLSLNALSGTIPKSLEKLSYLKSINVSFNDLEGEIPSGGVFTNSTLQSFLGNKGTLFGGTAVAIKVLDLKNEKVCKRFDTKCEVMRNVRHINLVPVITTCSSDYIRAFVLQIMPNGSLENWLYKEDRHLNLHQRVVTVMLDAAMAVEYLHHGHVTPIVHCDLKPANVLLDDDMVAHVGDFGISKILAISKFMAYTETLGTLRYIAPEYGSEGLVSANGDVYSYGIMLMEVLTKRRPTDEKLCNENLDLRKWIIQSFSGSMMDANHFCEEVQITCKTEICIASMIELSLDCTKETPESRITMKDVVKRLKKINNTFLETEK
ncbi:hypothetical protein MTR67_017096 [Solanum verrucosum]|uniref:non-specific serine/threonine protein kinase n=1 Tax=Solanum verrucosum TaxID=315347 RepID=A0AAF0QN62_SOLVR|nr:hypothetical protein MTR67_017096 [Solanum verrucosum]